MAGIIQLLISDITMSFMWVWSSVLIKIFVHDVLGYHHYDLHAEIIRYSLSIMNMFLFAYLAKVTQGGAYNPLTVLSSAISGSFGKFLFTLGSRIPLQVFGSVMGVRLILLTFPGIGRGPRLTVSLHQGALTEGLLTFTIVLISHALSTKIPGSFFRKTWISSVSKLALHILGSDLTGGCMNPASVSNPVVYTRVLLSFSIVF
ncbi:small and basic intrinsic protein 2,1 [Artemisia annua]|uniref:Small and basic intrinsic protein 2,1 n=1 Tax=Artemisia annua TaxID=35608 RepID=A0A2U1L8J6_ARTAN|nr:small and basic intrinsic protein 2,1 [Artemisia annua]